MKRIIKDEDLDIEYSAKGLSKELNVSVRQIHYYRENGQLGYEHRNRCRFVYPKEKVIEFLCSKWGYEYEK